MRYEIVPLGTFSIFNFQFSIIMKVIETEIEGVFILEPRVFGDDRGYFFESFSLKYFEEKVALSITSIYAGETGESGERSSFGCCRGYS